jgi:hypothetical protein
VTEIEKLRTGKSDAPAERCVRPKLVRRTLHTPLPDLYRFFTVFRFSFLTTDYRDKNSWPQKGAKGAKYEHQFLPQSHTETLNTDFNRRDAASRRATRIMKTGPFPAGS